MDPMRYLREQAERRAFARQGKELPKGQFGIPGGDNSDSTVETVSYDKKMDEWDRMNRNQREAYLMGARYPKPYYSGQNVAMAKANIAKEKAKANNR
jgi:hypothetical protein